MDKQKPFFKKYEMPVIIVVALLLIYLIVVFNQKINFLLGNELIVSLNPPEKSLIMHYGDKSRIGFDVSIGNAAYCKASCSYSFTDRSANSVIDKGEFILKSQQHIAKSYEVSVKRLGSGQDIYSFDVQCRSIRSFLCLTRGDEKSRSSLVTLNYDLTETEKELKKTLGQNVTELLEQLAASDVMLQQLSQKYFELAHKANLLNLSSRKAEIDDAYGKTRLSIENLRSVWSVENYTKLSKMFNESFFASLDNIKKSIDGMDKDIDNVILLHNELLSRLGEMGRNLNELNEFISSLEGNKVLTEFSINIAGFDNVSSSMTNNTFESYGKIGADIDSLVKQEMLLIERTKAPAIEMFFSLGQALKGGKDLLCSLKQDCKENITLGNVIKNSGEFAERHPDSLQLKQACSALSALEEEYLRTRNESLAVIEEKRISFPSDNRFLELADSFRENELRKINNSYYESLEKAKSGNKTDFEIIRIAEQVLPKNISSIMALDYNESINISLYLLSKINASGQISRLMEKCSSLGKPARSLGSFNFELISLNISYNLTSKIDTNLSDNPPICCIFSKCQRCCVDESCKNDPKTFPVIFLHGHSLAKDNSPEFSLDSFDKLQSRLQDDGYLNAGIVSLYSRNEQLQKGIWGLSGRPVSVKASYYYDAFKKEDKYIVVPTKSESIDTYALRLKDIMELVKERTGKPKVNIIAHSMGGLVARRYIQIFGAGDVDRVIMIATPNKGISGPIGDYCSLVGENRECSEMQENSLFINKLNDPLSQPSNLKIYAIIGQGCKMKLGDGDGIALSKNAEMENAEIFKINGTCSSLFGENLHTEILNIDKYPETYSIIKEILNR
ncbi:alpha/beta fold hydrolase [Candidatus Woesearchaeota archaeon]|nr:alpha/beta fold hydrolase [Candidatus Woesearchaeota archaeon]